MLERRRGLAGLVAALFVLAVFAPEARSDKGTITIAALTGWPPFSGKNLLNNGFANEVLTTALDRAGYNVQITLMPWPRAVQTVREGEHAVLSSVWYTDERAKHFAFTKPIATNRIVFITRKERDFTFNGLSSLDGMQVGVARNFHYSDAFVKAENFERRPAPNLLANLFAVDRGRVDVAVGDAQTARYLLSANRGRFEHTLTVTDEALQERDLHAGVSKAIADPGAVVKAIDDALAAMREDGTYETIRRKHGLQMYAAQ